MVNTHPSPYDHGMMGIGVQLPTNLVLKERTDNIRSLLSLNHSLVTSGSDRNSSLATESTLTPEKERKIISKRRRIESALLKVGARMFGCMRVRKKSTGAMRMDKK
jgi:hypothetical protein